MGGFGMDPRQHRSIWRYDKAVKQARVTPFHPSTQQETRKIFKSQGYQQVGLMPFSEHMESF
jgi:hypothetical protein